MLNQPVRFVASCVNRDDTKHKAATPPAAILTEESGARFYRIPHKEGPHAKCGTLGLRIARQNTQLLTCLATFDVGLTGNPLAKDYGTAIQQGVCTSAV